MPSKSPITNNQSPDLPDDVVLSVSGVSKKFCRNLKRSMLYGMRDLGRNLIGLNSQRVPSDEPCVMRETQLLTPHSSLVTPPLRRDEFWALQDVNFTLKRGECLGLIGQNGSGKTTLLRLLTGIFPPEAGEIAVRGRVGAIIALGAGFHPLMTGRENIYLNGSILGLTQTEIKDQIDEIMDFADIGPAIDAPVATYSSGMTVRLGFAIATTITPDLLLIDEVLAVGDAAFRGKCYNRIGKLLSHTAVILVSHNMTYISQVCSRVMHLHNGIVDYDGDPNVAVERYLAVGSGHSGGGQGIELMEPPVESCSLRMASHSVILGQDISVNLSIKSAESASNCLLRVVITQNTTVSVAEWNSDVTGRKIDINEGVNSIDLPLGVCRLCNGTYHLDVYLLDQTRLRHLVYVRDKYTLNVSGSKIAPAPILLPL